MTMCKKLIEVAMPVKEISAESVRDKSIRHGHISTLHLWWARRPLPVCRAVVFASLVYDPLDPNCPEQFKDAVKQLLSDPRYRPYDDIPWTAAKDPLEDNLRNRLIAFIGKFSDKYVECESKGKKCPPKEQLSDFSLLKWEVRKNEEIINIARKLIWVAHDPEKNTLDDFDKCFKAIKSAENNLYSLKDRHIDRPEVKEKQEVLDAAIKAFLDRMPRVFDPFAGGGAIPLEAARLGCNSYANDLNPVAHIIEKASIEFPQKYGKPIVFSVKEFEKTYGEDAIELQCKEGNIRGDEVHIPNRLAWDVEYYCKKMINMTENEIGHLYPLDRYGNKPIVYFWVRVGTCSNPSCKAKVPLMKQFYLSNLRNGSKKVFLKPVIEKKSITFEIKRGECKIEGYINRGNLRCPCCGSVTDVGELKNQFLQNQIEERLVAILWNSENGKEYRLPEKNDYPSSVELSAPEIPNEKMQPNSAGGDILGWGYKSWGQLYSKRQLLLLQSLTCSLGKINEFLRKKDENYANILSVYAAILIDRIAARGTSFGKWHILQETVEHPFGRQAIQINFDYPEINTFGESSNNAFGQLETIIDFIFDESEGFPVKQTYLGSADQCSTNNKIDAVISDPPYYDAIAYADISDFFYVWLKRALRFVFPSIFAFPQTPKADECTALKHHHADSMENAKNHFESKLAHSFRNASLQTTKNGIVVIMFAHQSTEAWTTLCNSILVSSMNMTSSWAFDSEVTAALKADKAYLASSVTVSCRPSQRSGIGSFREVKNAIESTVGKVVHELYTYGFRGADLLTACFGFAVAEFGKYEKVEKASGDEVTVQELLEMARESAFNAIISDINTDDTTRFYIGWLNLFGFTDAEHDDVRRITQIGLNIDINELLSNHILLRNGNKQTLATVADRTGKHPKIGLSNNPLTIDKVHRAMHLFSGSRAELVSYIAKVASSTEDSFWRVATALAEVLPAGTNDHTLASGLAANKESLLRDAKQVTAQEMAQTSLFE
ncbi:MAG: DUF1156 domain-containing protein [Chitinispirillaceae bacterium]|nr:DUF1156 domain-containing protein [Chitinispirillaceae bacterium]